MMLATLCEKGVFKNVSCVDISDNLNIIDINFIENVVRIFRALGLIKMIILKSGCEKSNIKEIKKMLGVKKKSLSIIFDSQSI